MNKNKPQKAPEQPPSPTFKFYLGSRERYIVIDCNFEAGNIQLVRQMSQFHYHQHTVSAQQHRRWYQNWQQGQLQKLVLFQRTGLPQEYQGEIRSQQSQHTHGCLRTQKQRQNHHPKSYRPVYRQCILQKDELPSWSQWRRVPTECPLILRQNGQLECTFDFLFRNQGQKVEFAFTYPYSYSRCIQLLGSLNDFYYHDEFYFYKEVLARSPEGRDIHLLTVTSHDHPHPTLETEELFNPILFPQKARPKRFKKPVILISARVHPGETSASFAMEGVIKFLVEIGDVRAHLLRKMFVFMVVPMINVDGVFHGHFRMDGFGKNLNRYYVDPCPQKQPAVYAIKELAKHLVKQNRLSFYFDLHAHNARKGHFIYGNAINDFVEQVESQVFCKLIATNNPGFEYGYCNFSKQQMNSRDKYEQRTKEGCGRVVMHRLAGIIHSYSLQCGIIAPTKSNTVPSPPNQDFCIDQKGLVEHDRTQPPMFDQESYYKLGKSLLVSVLDVFDKNPYNRIYNSAPYKSMQMLRRITAFEVFHKDERFRMFEKYVYGKVKNINELIKDVLYSKLHYRQLYNFYFYNDNELKSIEWPQNIPGLIKPKPHRMKRFRSLQQPKTDYSLSFINDLRINKDQLQLQQLPAINTPPLQPINDDNYSSETEGEQEEKEEDAEENERRIIEELMQAEAQLCNSETGNLGDFDDYRMSSWAEAGPSGPADYYSCEAIPSDSTPTEGFSPEKAERQNDSEEDTGVTFKMLKQLKRLNKLRIPQREQIEEEQQLRMVQNESPSVRVRRLMKQDTAGKKTRLTKEQMREKLTSMNSVGHDTSPVLASPGSAFKAEREMIFQNQQMRIFAEIKMQIKQELRRNKDRRGLICSSVKVKSKGAKQSSPAERQSIRSTNLNFLNLNTQINLAHQKHHSATLQRNSSKGYMPKTQLPALNSHMLIINSNSSKGFKID